MIGAVRRGLWAATRHVVRDSRGKTVAVFDSRVRLWRDPPGLDFPREDFRRVARRIGWAIRPRETTPVHEGKGMGEWIRDHRELLIGGIGAALLTYVLASTILYARGPQKPAMIAWNAVMLAIIVMGQLFAWRRRIRVFPRGASELQIARALLAEGRCPSCAYAIGRVEPAMDGCVVCPECAGAWRLGREDAVRAVFNMGEG